jgi:hypothetical protein
MMSITSTTAAIISRPIGIAQPIRLGKEHFQAPLAGLNRTTQKQLVKQMENDGDNLATWQWKTNKLVSAPFSRLRSCRVCRHPIAAATRIAARVTLVAARSAAARAAASATRQALKHVIPNAIKWGPQVARRAGVNQATRTIGRAARRGAGRAGTTSGRVMGTAGQRSWQALTRVAEVARQHWGQTSTAWRSSIGRLFRGRRTRRMDILQIRNVVTWDAAVKQ